jgi:hypothetical protein
LFPSFRCCRRPLTKCKGQWSDTKVVSTASRSHPGAAVR